MFHTGSELIGKKILSLHLAYPIGIIESVIIDPDNLSVPALVSVDRGQKSSGNILDTRRIREISRLGVIIDSEDDFEDLNNLVRISQIESLKFKLIGLRVETKRGEKLGKVSDYIIKDDFQIIQIIVKRPLLRAFKESELIISRKQIIDIDDYKITVKDLDLTQLKDLAEEDFIPNFVNPFREPGFLPTDNQNPDALNKQ